MLAAIQGCTDAKLRVKRVLLQKAVLSCRGFSQAAPLRPTLKLRRNDRIETVSQGGRIQGGELLWHCALLEDYNNTSCDRNTLSLLLART